MTWKDAVRWLAWLHRWTGVALCLLFALWFVSGAVLLFVPFPALGDDDRFAASATFDPASLRIAPAQALSLAGGGDGLRLTSSGGRPVYLVASKGGPVVRIDGVSGARLPNLTASQASATAIAFARRSVRSLGGPFDYDQWVVHQKFDPWRPFYRAAIADPAGTELYVSARTGEVVQRTRAAERAWNWPGAVTHWLYFTALRRSFAAWDQTVWWVSLIGLVSATVGVFLGIYRSVNRLRRPKPRWSPFHGWLKWHHLIGLAVGAFVLTWILSGWLSMDHGRLFTRGTPRPDAEARYETASLAHALASTPASALDRLGPASEIDVTVVAGHPLAAARGGGRSGRVLVLDARDPTPTASAPASILGEAVSRAWPGADGRASGDARGRPFDAAAEGLPADALRFPLPKWPGGAAYVDPLSGRVLVVMDESRIAYAWIYYALHTFNFPGLVEHPVLRRVIVLPLLLLGMGFSLTGLVVAGRRLNLSFNRPKP